MKKILMLFVLVLLLGACAPAADGGDVGSPGFEGGPEPLGAAAYVNSAELEIMESYPVQVAVHVVGDLPTPCHEFRYQYELQIFGEENRVDITVFSEGDPEAICTQVLEPFDERIRIPLEDAPDGLYVVYVNGERVGEFSYPA